MKNKKIETAIVFECREKIDITNNELYDIVYKLGGYRLSCVFWEEMRFPIEMQVEIQVKRLIFSQLYEYNKNT